MIDSQSTSLNIVINNKWRFQHLHEETAKLSKSIFDASKVTVVEDEVEVDIFDVEDDDSTDTEVETQNDIKEENEKNSKASSCIQVFFRNHGLVTKSNLVGCFFGDFCY